ncbi:GMP synthase [Motiliproteus sp. SC1-56]|uniref:glutamine amidotransferase-related protein n=1 Tax=Motiliproteus sp. SC1-56 TaxID=2799565 RepID=UPI001A90A4F1|nr:GMP synthase [Motiliproteus sp. SC1-56]
MKIGILQCDDVLEALQPEFGNYPAMFEQMLGEFAPGWQFVTYRVIDGLLPRSVDECDGYITTGSRHGINDGAPWIDQLQRFVAELAQAEKKYVGICFGHQLLAKALGGEVGRSARGWGVGVSFTRINIEKPWMKPFQPGLDLVVSHQDQIEVLPEGAEVLASSAFCPYYMVQYNRHLMTIQGHPEFSKAYSSALMDYRKDRIPAERIREGKASLSAEVDDRLTMQWIINFFAEGHTGD